METTSSPLNTNSNKTITTITIVHKTGRPRIIDDKENIADIRFNDLIESMNNSTEFSQHIKVIYCKFAKNQVSKLVQSTNYVIDSNTVKEKSNGLYELKLTRQQKHYEDLKLFA